MFIVALFTLRFAKYKLGGKERIFKLLVLVLSIFKYFLEALFAYESLVCRLHVLMKFILYSQS